MVSPSKSHHPQPKPVDKLVEKRLQTLLSTGFKGLDADEQLEAIKLGIDWVKAQRKDNNGDYGKGLADLFKKEEANE